ncbi:MAG: hypothetical protein ACKOAU_15755 [Pirellula sp.]
MIRSRHSFIRHQYSQGCLTCLAVAICLLTAGCGASNKPILPSSVNQASDASDEAVADVVHPEYANWSRFAVGDQVVRHRIVSNKMGKVEVTSVLSLAEKTEAYVDVVSQVNVQREGETLQENPPETTRFPSRFKLPNGLTEDFFKLPSNKAIKVGDDTQVVEGKTIQTEIFEWTEHNESGPMTVKLWRSDEVPGRIVRQEMLVESSQTKTVEEIKQVRW